MGSTDGIEEREAIARAWSMADAEGAEESLPPGAVTALPPGALDAIEASRPLLVALQLGAVVLATAAVAIFQLRMLQSTATLLGLFFAGAAVGRGVHRENWRRFTGETLPVRLVADLGWTLLSGAAIVASLLAGDPGKVAGGGFLVVSGVYLVWRGRQGLEPLAAAPLRFDHPESVQRKGRVRAAIGGLIVLSGTAPVPGPLLLASFLVVVVAAKGRRPPGLAVDSDVAHDPRMALPPWVPLVAAVAGALFAIVAIATDPSF